MRVLVCGGRMFGRIPDDTPDLEYQAREQQARNERNFLKAKLFQLRGQGMSVLIHGAAKGADSLAGAWAKFNGIPTEVYPADWERYGRRAGAIRNEQMLLEGKPDVVLAFPGGRGTDHMTRIAVEAEVPVWLA